MKNFSRYFVIALSIIAVIVLTYIFSNIVMYVLISWVLAMLGQPLMKLFQKIKIGKFKVGPNMGAILTLTSFFVIISLLFSLFVPLIIQQASNLAEVDYAAVATALEEPIGQANEWLIEHGVDPKTADIDKGLQDAFGNIFQPGMVANFLSSTLGAAGSIFFAIFSIVFITFFFLKERGLFDEFVLALVPDKYDKQVKEVFDDSSYLLSRYFRGILTQITIITLYMWIMLSIFGIQNALLIGLFAAIINVIPYIGPLLGALFGVFITISSNLDLEFYNEMLPLILTVVAIFASMQLIDNVLLVPFIFSNSVLAHPLEVFLVILMGAQLFGIVGMVLALPTYTVIRVIAKEFLNKFKIVQKLTGKMKEVVD